MTEFARRESVNYTMFMRRVAKLGGPRRLAARLSLRK